MDEETRLRREKIRKMKEQERAETHRPYKLWITLCIEDASLKNCSLLSEDNFDELKKPLSKMLKLPEIDDVYEITLKKKDFKNGYFEIFFRWYDNISKKIKPQEYINNIGEIINNDLNKENINKKPTNFAKFLWKLFDIDYVCDVKTWSIGHRTMTHDQKRKEIAKAKNMQDRRKARLKKKRETKKVEDSSDDDNKLKKNSNKKKQLSDSESESSDDGNKKRKKNNDIKKYQKRNVKKDESSDDTSESDDNFGKKTKQNNKLDDNDNKPKKTNNNTIFDKNNEKTEKKIQINESDEDDDESSDDIPDKFKKNIKPNKINNNNDDIPDKYKDNDDDDDSDDDFKEKDNNNKKEKESGRGLGVGIDEKPRKIGKTVSFDKFEGKDGEDDSEKAFRYWLTEICNMDKYLDVFIENKMNRLINIMDLDKEELLELGIDNRKDYKIILKKVLLFDQEFTQFKELITKELNLKKMYGKLRVKSIVYFSYFKAIISNANELGDIVNENEKIFENDQIVDAYNKVISYKLKDED